MTVRAFAERILFGATIEDKLAPPEGDDSDPGTPIEAPPAPARPVSLAFPSARRATFEFPSPKQLEDDTMRGKALHFFANHELLALELMALMLLRFPDAPRELRAGLVRTMIDEQKHLRLYRARMNALGVELGDVPVNDYFWRAMKNARSPLEFMTSMSLTFEQANLDFTRHYAELARRAGDDATASVLDAVYADEVRHVQHGLGWLMRSRSPGEDDWDAYVRLVPKPLSPARAKGSVFDVEGRRKAGLSERFIRELSIYSHSKGRTPAVFAFEAAFEEALAAGDRWTPPQAVLDIEHDLAPLMMFLAARDDVVLVPERPSIEHLESLARAGFTIPELRTYDDPPEGPFASLTGWGISPRSRARAERLGISVALTPHEVVSKRFGLSLRHELTADLSAVTTGASETSAHAERIFSAGYDRAVAKALFSSSGRHRIFLRPGPLEPNLARWLEERTVIVEPWLDRVRDLSLLIEVKRDSIERISFDRFLTDQHGRYRGHVLAPPLWGLELESFFRKNDLFAELDRIAQHVGRRLREAGYLGPAGIDMLLHERDSELHLLPIVEVNPRLTMGFIARALKKRIAPGSYGVWIHAPIAEVQGDLPPLERSDRGIVRGAIATNDLSQARSVGTVLYVDPDLEAIEARCRSR